VQLLALGLRQPAEDVLGIGVDRLLRPRLGLCASGREGAHVGATILGVAVALHVADEEALEAALISDGLAECAELCGRAIRDGDDPLLSLGNAYRSFARSHPHLYRLMTERPLPRDLLTPGVEERAARPLVEVVGGDPDDGRALWAFAHGMVVLEIMIAYHRMPTSTPPGCAD
jgi:hypothetical protein